MTAEWTDADLDRFLRCPVTGEGLRWLDAVRLKAINDRVAAGDVVNRVGMVVQEPFDAALINRSGTLLIPCYGGLPSLLADEMIELERLNLDWNGASESR